MSPQDDPLLPWHGERWQILQRARREERLPHALLITGPAGAGKRVLADLLARSLLCAGPDAQGLPCGRCRDCLLLAAGTHPDRIPVGPDPDGKSHEIKVDAVRRLADTDALTAHRGGWKVILIDPAHQMNTSAANSLLKTLEEPAPQTLLCLVSERPGRLPATIRSRCQEVRVPLPALGVGVEWLRGRLSQGDPATLLSLAHGAPLAALALAEPERLAERERLFAGFVGVARGERDPIAEAAAWNRSDPGISLDWLAGWLSDLLRLVSGHPAPRLINADKSEALRALAARIAAAPAHRFLGRALAARSSEDSTVNRLLLLESLLGEWAGIGSPT